MPEQSNIGSHTDRPVDRRSLPCVSPRRKKRQGGQEFLEFGLVVPFMLFPMLLGTFTAGMNLLITVQAKDVIRDAANLYIHGTDFSAYASQQLVQRLAKGLNFQIASSDPGNQQSSLVTGGNGVIMVSQLEYIGSSTSPNCSSVPSGTTCNASSYVFTQRVVFGSSAILAAHPSAIGDYSTTGGGTNCGLPTGSSPTISNTGQVPYPVWNTCAKLSTSGTSAVTAAFTGVSPQTALKDGQVIYMVEGYFDTSSYNFAGFGNQSVYARYFF